MTAAGATEYVSFDLTGSLGTATGVQVNLQALKADSTARPDTSRTPMSWLRQYRQIGWGGWISAEQARHSWIRSLPSSPDFQKNSLSNVSCGSRIR